jgi:flagellar basal-body rod modification protein FlgD
MDVTSTTSVTKTKGNDFVYNPDSQLTSDDFLKLFMTELQYQDPTDPMKTSDMLNQESQLTQLQTNQDLKDALNKLTASLSSSSQYGAVDMIGKMANTGANGFSVTDAANLNGDIPFDLYFGNDYKEATIKITDRNGDVIKDFSLDNGQKGIQSFTWDGTDNNGNPVEDGEYYVTADYTTLDNQNKSTMLGTYPIESVKFDKGQASVKVDNKYIPLDSIKEVF